MIILFCHCPLQAEGTSLGINGSASLGYDSNPYLDASKKSDFFAQETLDILLKHPLEGDLALVADFDLLNTNYFEATDVSFFYPVVKAGLNYRLNHRATLESRYVFSYLLYPDNEDGDVAGHGVEVALSCSLNPKIRSRAGFNYTLRDFDSRKSRLPSGVLSSDEREDDRYRIFSSLSFRWLPRVLTRVSYDYTLNDSNHQFLDYYDYDAHRVVLGTGVRLHRKLRGNVFFGYEYREYDSRLLLLDAQTVEDNDVYKAGAELRYQWLENISLSYRYFWRQKDSKEPTQEYNEIIQTLGLFYSF